MALTCSTCNMDFARPDTLKRHQSTRHHKQKQDQLENACRKVVSGEIGQHVNVKCTYQNRTVTMDCNGSSSFPAQEIPDTIHQLIQLYSQHVREDATVLENTMKKFFKR